jgi:nucleotide-binding universal stress UspA family protein
MIMAFRKILCPTDFSAEAQQAMAVAARIARETSAELEIAHVWDLPPRAFSSEYGVPDELIKEVVDDAGRALDAATRDVAALGVLRVTSRLLRGVPWDQIVQAARADAAIDVIIMSTHGRTGLSRVFLGSVTEQVIRHAPCCVLGIRQQGARLPFRNILCPIDFSEDSRHAVLRAADLVGSDGRIKLLHVIEPAITASGVSIGVNQRVETDRRVTQELASWASDLAQKASLPVTTAVEIGRPGARILATLDADPTIDLVIMGSHGRTGIQRILLGSVAEKVLRHAACPVLIERSTTA